MRIVFLGTGEIGVPSLKALMEDGHDVAGVFTQPDRPAGRDMKLRPSPVKQAAMALGLPVFQPLRLRAAEAVGELRSLVPDLVVVVAYGQILSREVLDLPRFGCLNIHASLLPRHRGASPIQAAILAGDGESGVTIMQMDEGLDTGDILLQESFSLARHETGGGLHDRLAAQAPGLLRRVLDQIGEGTLRRVRQDASLATYAPKLSKDDGRIDWTLPAVEIDRRIRAFTPWPGAFTFFPHQEKRELLKIHRAAVCRRCRAGKPGEVLRADQRGILVRAGEGAILLCAVQAAGAKRLGAGDFLRGRPLARGAQIG